MIIGRTDLRISRSRATFDTQADFDVRFAAARPNLRQISEKQNLRFEMFAEQKLCGVEKSNVRNYLKRVLPKFRANRSQV